MANNKVQLADGTVLMDVTDTTALASTVKSGDVFYNAAGIRQTGTLIVDETYSIQQNLTNVISSVDDTKVIAGNCFYTKLTPSEGYNILSVIVTMDGVDITNQVFKPGTGEKVITANGTYAASSDSLDGYSSVTVNVPSGGSSPNLQSKTVTYTPSTSTQTETITADAGYDGLSSVGVAVSPIPSEYVVPSGSQTITENGTYDVSSIASAVVNVASGGGDTSKTYIIKDGKIQQGFSFSVYRSTTVAEETADGTDYVKVNINGNNYGGCWTQAFSVSGFSFAEMELVEIDGAYGYTYQSSNDVGTFCIGNGSPTSSYHAPTGSITKLNTANGRINQSKFVVGVPPTTSGSGFLKFCISGASSYNGRLNIRNLFLVES